MQLALRKTAATSATTMQRIYAWLIRWRLASEYCHGGMVINNTLYHATALKGLHQTSFDPAKWQLYELGDTYDDWMLNQFKRLEGAKYDWRGILGFEIPLPLNDQAKFYCFEWCWFAMLGNSTAQHKTPELLLTQMLNDVRFINLRK